MVEAQKISLNAAKTAFAAMEKSGNGAEATIAELGLAQVSDETAIAAACDKVLAAEAAKVAEYRAGRDKLFGFFVGAVMKAMGGKANQSDQRNPARKTRRLTDYFGIYTLYVTPPAPGSPVANACKSLSHAYLPLVEVAKTGVVARPCGPLGPIFARPVYVM